ncbi:hypothetical protein H8D36_04885 [archaeon]|nr:hypothetical protein [archaeon]MBL7056658.1 hypothetical protein [Candidatus Woesearchaeota archaeon]
MRFFKGFKEGMTCFGDLIAIIVNTVLLFIAYFIGVGITSIVAKIVGKNFLEMKTSAKVKTYWSDLNIKKRSLEECYRQF